MTDLEKYVNEDGREELIKQVREKIDELGVTYIYYQFISCLLYTSPSPRDKRQSRMPSSA